MEATLTIDLTNLKSTSLYLGEVTSIEEVSKSLPQKGRSWTLPCFVLKQSDVTSPPDEEVFVTQGPLHPVPPPAPRWFGFEQPAGSESTPTAPMRETGMHVEAGHNRWMEQLAPQDPVSDSIQFGDNQSEIQKGKGIVVGNNNQTLNIQGIEAQIPSSVRPSVYNPKVTASIPTLKSIIIGPAAPRDPNDPLVAVVPSLLKKVLNFFSVIPSQNVFRNFTCLDIDHDTPIPSFFNDHLLLAYLACILYPQIDDDALKKIGWDYMDVEDEEMTVNEEIPIVGDDAEHDAEFETEEAEEDLEVLESPPPIFMTPRRKKAFKVKEKLDDSFLRRSKRISNRLQGYKDTASASKAHKTDEVMEENNEPMPLCLLPSSPHPSMQLLLTCLQRSWRA